MVFDPSDFLPAIDDVGDSCVAHLQDHSSCFLWGRSKSGDGDED
jgi:hypothetical protein